MSVPRGSRSSAALPVWPAALPSAAPGAAREASIDALVLASPGWLDPLDIQAAALLSDLAGEDRPAVRLALALTSRQLRRGHVCLDLRALASTGAPLDDEGEALGDLCWPGLEAWLAALAESPLVLTAADGTAPGGLRPEPVPLVLEQPSGRLYLRRWWDHEAALAQALLRRAEAEDERLDPGLAPRLARLFPAVAGPNDAGRRDQAAAVTLAARRRLAVITGGPGTGKTTTVLRLLALLAEQALARGQTPPRILLLAPTGKASARLEESVTGARARLPVEESVRTAIPSEARTIHRALGWLPGGRWRHDASNPLVADVVVVDEASMIDLALMRALVDALRPEARLILLGDRDQLSSVDAGAVLGDICGEPGPVAGAGVEVAGGNRADDDRPDATGNASRQAGEAPPIAACIARLGYSFRFGTDTGIGGLARAIQAGDTEAALALLADPKHPDVRLVSAPAVEAGNRLQAGLAREVLAGYGPYLEVLAAGGVDRSGPDPSAIAAALEAFGRFRVLCAHRQGPSGVATLGRAVIEALALAGRVGPQGESWAGRPVLVTRNDPALGLFNGDVGLIARDATMEGRLRAFFPGAEGLPRAIAPPRLPPHETAFSMSIHKSQGSEFDRVAVILPHPDSPLLSRELLYTAVTRARRSVLVFATAEALKVAIERRARRASGLRQRLWER